MHRIMIQAGRYLIEPLSDTHCRLAGFAPETLRRRKATSLLIPKTIKHEGVKYEVTEVADDIAEGTPKEKAMWYLRAKEHGNRHADEWLFHLYFDLMKADLEAAVNLLLSMDFMEDDTATFILACIYLESKSRNFPEWDEAKGMAQMQRAADSGNPFAIRYLEDLKNSTHRPL